ncbi:MAG: PAS domain S-box protein [Nitrospinae bacterium]|nr:PAS domain S-box protein [Nitrospinota bacterium]
MSVTDISALERVRSRLRQLSAIVESSADAIIGTTLHGVVTTWNNGAERLYGYSMDEAVGSNIDKLATPASPRVRPAPRLLRMLRDPDASDSPVGWIMTSRATTAMTTPTASMRTPSASRTLSTRCTTLMRRSKGVITVGPVTMTRVPNRMECVHSHPMNRRAANAPPTAVTSTPDDLAWLIPILNLLLDDDSEQASENAIP